MSSDRMPPGFCQNSRWEVLRFFMLSSLEFAILKELIQRGRRGFSFPSISLIARSTGYSNRSIQRGLEKLVALGLLRRTRFLRRNGTKGVYFYYLTFSGLLSEQSSGHPDQKPPVTNSAHNLKNQQIDSKRLDKIVELEKHVFDILEPVLALKASPQLIDGSLLTEWLYYRRRAEVGALEDFVMDQADQLLMLHQKHRTKLKNWHHFIQQLEGNANSDEIAFGGVHPKLERRIVQYLVRAREDRNSRRRKLSQIPDILADDDGLVLLISCYEDHRVLSQANGIVKGLVTAIRLPVRLRFAGTETDPIYPKGRA